MAQTRPLEISKTHWLFQTKLAKPQFRNSRLVYTSTSPFGIDEAEAWQLSWDAIQIVDKELRHASDLLADGSSRVFQAVGVVGADSAAALTDHIQVTDWKPLPTEVRVSDVPHLARMLGGQGLYSDWYIPVRELIQNAADAIEARVAVDDDFSLEDGQIKIRIKKEGGGLALLSVEDNGIGMSETTLTGALLDFGFSFWKSEAAREEFPGLQWRFKNPRGRYGIGFFPVFMWSDNVQVCTRRHTEGTASARILEFKSGLGRRPIVRPAKPSETSAKYNTRVTIVFDESKIVAMSRKTSRPRYLEYEVLLEKKQPASSKIDWANSLKEICGTLPMRTVLDAGGKTRAVNLAKWKSAKKNQFQSFFFPNTDKRTDQIHKRYGETMFEVKGDNGEIVGRAYMCPNLFQRYSPDSKVLVYERGIYVGRTSIPNVFGVLEGTAENAARDRFSAPNIQSDKDWVARESEELFKVAKDIGERVQCQEALLGVGTFNQKEVMFIKNRMLCSLDDVCEQLLREDDVVIVMDKIERSSELRYEVPKVETINAIIGKSVASNRLFFLTNMECEFDMDMRLPDWLSANTDTPFGVVLSRLVENLGGKSELDAVEREKSSYVRDMEVVATIRKRR